MLVSKARKGIVGQFYDGSERTTWSLFAEEDIPIGSPLMRGTNKETQCKVYNGGITDEMIGIAGFSHLQVTPAYSATRPQSYYTQYTPVTVVHAGKIYAPLYGSLTIAVGDTAYIDTLLDKITNVYVDQFQSLPIGKFLTGGVNEDYVSVFVLELIPGFSENIPATQANKEVSKEKTLEVNFKKQKEKK